ncbi:MAG: hypothetical protein RLN96_01425, partial [Pseudomonadales bacterium]
MVTQRFILFVSVIVSICMPEDLNAKTLGIATKCGPFYKYIELDRYEDPNAVSCRTSGHCVTYSLIAPENDAEEISELFTYYEPVVGEGSRLLARGRILKRERLVPLPFLGDPMAVFGLSRNILSILNMMNGLGDLGDHVTWRGETYYCGPHNYTPILKGNKFEFDNSYSHSWSDYRYRSGMHVCNLTSVGFSFATSSVHNSTTKVGFSPDKKVVFRGWFNLRPEKCMSISNIFDYNKHISLTFMPDVEGSHTVRYGIDSSHEGLVGFAGFRNVSTPMCVSDGQLFRRTLPADSVTRGSP